MLARNETTSADGCPALPALDAITDEHLFSIVTSLLHSRQELRDAVIATLGERTEPNIPWVPVEALGSFPELDMRYLMPPSPTPPAPPPVKPPTRKRPSQGSRSTRASKSQRREGSNDTLLRLMRGEEVLDSSYTAVFKAEDERLGEHGSTAQPSSDASSRLESIDSAASNLPGSSSNEDEGYRYRLHRSPLRAILYIITRLADWQTPDPQAIRATLALENGADGPFTLTSALLFP